MIGILAALILASTPPCDGTTADCQLDAPMAAQQSEGWRLLPRGDAAQVPLYCGEESDFVKHAQELKDLREYKKTHQFSTAAMVGAALVGVTLATLVTLSLTQQGSTK